MEIEQLVIETSERSKSNTHRIDGLEKDNEVLHELATSVAIMAENIKTMNAQLEAQGKRLEQIEKQPAQRWETLVRTILTGIVSALVGGAIGAIITQMAR